MILKRKSVLKFFNIWSLLTYCQRPYIEEFRVGNLDLNSFLLFMGRDFVIHS